MILNISKIKTESLLLFCRDIIISYKGKKDQMIYDVDIQLIKDFDDISDEMLKNIANVTFPDSYYIQNAKHYRIKSILNGYKFLNKELSNNLSSNERFNPSMLYFSFLALWFKELNKESISKEYIYFIIYPYFQVYDKFLVNMNNQEFKILNKKMVQLAEKVIYKFDEHNILNN